MIKKLTTLKIVALLVNLVCVLAMIVFIYVSQKGFEIRNESIFVVIFSFMSIIFMNIRSFKQKRNKG